MAIEKWVEEFLWRGRHSGDTAPAGYHVIIGAIGPETMNKPIMSDPMTPTQADAQGFTLGKIIDGINQEAVTSRDAAITAQQAAEADRDAKVTALESDRDEKITAAGVEADAKITAARVEADAQIAKITADRDKAIVAQKTAEADRDAKVAALTAERGAAIAALPKTPPGSITAAAFQSRFTTEEQRAIWLLAKNDETGAIGQGLTQGLTSQTIDLTADGLKEWMAALVGGGALTTERATVIMTP